MAMLFAVQPFGNSLVTLELTGAQIERMLEQQWLDQPKPRILHVSDGLHLSLGRLQATGRTRRAGEREP